MGYGHHSDSIMRFCVGPEGCSLGTVNSDLGTEITTTGGDVWVDGVDGDLSVCVGRGSNSGADRKPRVTLQLSDNVGQISVSTGDGLDNSDQSPGSYQAANSSPRLYDTSRGSLDGDGTSAAGMGNVGSVDMECFLPAGISMGAALSGGGGVQVHPPATFQVCSTVSLL